MTIYVDDPMLHIGGKFHGYSHMWCDGTTETLNELNDFAVRIGLRVEWLQFSKGVSGDFYHYDISQHKRAVALRAGAEYIPLSKWLAPKMNAWRDALAKQGGER